MNVLTLFHATSPDVAISINFGGFKSGDRGAFGKSPPSPSIPVGPSVQVLAVAVWSLQQAFTLVPTPHSSLNPNHPPVPAVQAPAFTSRLRQRPPGRRQLPAGPMTA